MSTYLFKLAAWNLLLVKLKDGSRVSIQHCFGSTINTHTETHPNTHTYMNIAYLNGYITSPHQLGTKHGFI